MMKKQIVLLTLMASASITQAAAPAAAAKPVCFKDEASYKAVKDQLPPLMQKTPLVFKLTGSDDTTAALKTEFVNGALKFNAVYSYWLAFIPQQKQESRYVSEVCVQGQSVTLATLDAQGAKTVKRLKITGPQNVSMDSYTFVASNDPAVYDRTEKSIFGTTTKNRMPAANPYPSSPAPSYQR